ncbi:hypothetical protein AXX17_AT5G34170 [Arabidopsis thaliana]|uniref:Uncharacterized protein n=1 Tax=Arabidopsis thaliana TaxID=3702 RepID=A0A178UA64_ARATH|nr:hypothetical protein AXX17_AT5G34170 [Arabidopsis thaliana]
MDQKIGLDFLKKEKSIRSDCSASIIWGNNPHFHLIIQKLNIKILLMEMVLLSMPVSLFRLPNITQTNQEA